MISMVDDQTPAAFAVRHHDASGSNRRNAQGNQQGWLKALESSGLREALDGIRSFRSEARPDSPAKVETAHVSKAGLPHQHSDASPWDGAQRYDEPADTAGVAYRSVAELDVGGNRETSPTPCCTLTLSGDHVVVDPPSETTLPQVVVLARRLERHDWTQRNLLLLLLVGGGAEIWIRDAKLDGATLDILLSTIRRLVAGSGAAPAKLYVNGQQVFPANSGFSE